MPELVGGKLTFKKQISTKKNLKKKQQQKQQQYVKPEETKDEGDKNEGVELVPIVKRTAAEQKFYDTQLKRNKELLLQRAKTSHKEKVEGYNKYLSELSEHYDVPKVSWTK